MVFHMVFHQVHHQEILIFHAIKLVINEILFDSYVITQFRGGVSIKSNNTKGFDCLIDEVVNQTDIYHVI